MSNAFALLIAVGWCGEALAEPTRESLIAVWEEQLRTDPLTKEFEPLGEGRFRYATQWFPFDGDIQVVSATVSKDAYQQTFGNVEVLLIGAEDEFYTKHHQAYYQWTAQNRWWFDDEAGQWSRDRTDVQPPQPSAPPMSRDQWIVFGVIVGISVPVFLLITWLAVREQRRQQEKLTALAESATRSAEAAERMAETLMGSRSQSAALTDDRAAT